MREIKFKFWDKDLKKMCERKPNNGDFTHPNIIPLQYTGLKDQNGVEIYEGDIVWYRVNGEGRSELSNIVFDSKQCGYFIKPLTTYGRLRNLTYSCKKYIVVIGNNYENPELLNG